MVSYRLNISSKKGFLDFVQLMQGLEGWIRDYLQPLSYHLCFFGRGLSPAFRQRAHRVKLPFDPLYLRQLREAGLLPYQAKYLLQFLHESQEKVREMQAELVELQKAMDLFTKPGSV
ncbi:MAG: hypothetical protein VW378_04565 [bacterium]